MNESAPDLRGDGLFIDTRPDAEPLDEVVLISTIDIDPASELVSGPKPPMNWAYRFCSVTYKYTQCKTVVHTHQCLLIHGFCVFVWFSVCKTSF